jgi:NADPH:quinone reductase-like Zn-dependent oxidoreductase
MPGDLADYPAEPPERHALAFLVGVRKSGDKMKAVVCTSYGPPEVLQLREVDKPIPGDDEVLVKIRATAVTASDIFIRGSQLPWRYRIPMRVMIGLTKPRRAIIGIVLAGEIESAGKSAKRFKIGDKVYGVTGFGLGAYAEYKCMKETDSKHGCLPHKPANISFEAATVAAYGGLLALQYLEKGNVKRGQRVLIYGASGTCGTTAVQIAKHWGAHVTGVCSTANLDLVKSLGADSVIDYTKENSADPGVRFDFILDAVGRMKTSRFKEVCRKALSPAGRYVSIDDGALKLDSGRLAVLKDLVEAGHVKPVIDRCYPLEKIVEAHLYVGEGHKKGGVAITI